MFSLKKRLGSRTFISSHKFILFDWIAKGKKIMATISDLLTSSFLSTVYCDSLCLAIYINCSQLHLLIDIFRGHSSIVNWLES